MNDLARTDWVLVMRSKRLIERAEFAGLTQEIDAIPNLKLWTDDYNNLFRILK